MWGRIRAGSCFDRVDTEVLYIEMMNNCCVVLVNDLRLKKKKEVQRRKKRGSPEGFHGLLESRKSDETLNEIPAGWGAEIA